MRSVTISIAGQQLKVRTDATDEALNVLLTEIETRVQAIQGGARGVASSQTLLLTCMSFAEDLMAARSDLARVKQRVVESSQLALDLLGPDAEPR